LHILYSKLTVIKIRFKEKPRRNSLILVDGIVRNLFILTRTFLKVLDFVLLKRVNILGFQDFSISSTEGVCYWNASILYFWVNYESPEGSFESQDSKLEIEYLKFEIRDSISEIREIRTFYIWNNQSWAYDGQWNIF
jgi:hypothetical protein